MKQKIGPTLSLYPSLTVLAGATVHGKPNFITIAHVGIMTLNHISLGINKAHFTNSGIRENRTFSVNIPSERLVKQTDYCGLVSGRKRDKSFLFDIFYGELKTAPMIDECPVNMECRLERIVDFPSHDVFVGEVVQTHVDEWALSGGKLDISQIKPLLFDMSSKKYWALGDPLADCWSVGKEIKKTKA